MVKGKARAAGSFLGGIANNPGIVILGALGIALLFFAGDIRKAFAGLGEGFGKIDITLPEIKFPDFPAFPEIKFPDFPAFPDFSDLFSGFQDQLSSIAGQIVELQGAQVTIPPDTMVDPDTGIVTSETPPLIDLGTQDDLSTLFGELRPQVFDTLINIGVSLEKATEILSGAKTFEDLQVIIQQANTGIFTQLQGTLDVLEQRVEQPGALVQPVSSFLLDSQQQFTGGGVSFIGGSIFETPITGQSTLSFIIDKLGVSASRAASIRAELRGFTPEEIDFLGGPQDVSSFTGFNPPAVSDPQFQGLTAQQIVLRLLGGNIQNF